MCKLPYEDKTYDNILTDMMGRVTTNVDKREGSIIFDALAPVAAALAESYINLGVTSDNVYADTATGSFLERRAVERGVIRKAATPAIRSAGFGLIQPALGVRFAIAGSALIYVVTDISGGPSYTWLTCETPGLAGNEPIGDLIPIVAYPTLEYAFMAGIVEAGTDEETDADLYARYIDDVNYPVFAGSAAHYKAWGESVTGVGAARCIPQPDRVGTYNVDVYVLNSSLRGANSFIIDAAQTYIDPDQDGNGAGQAPIGARVEVLTAAEVTIAVVATLTIEGGADLPTIKGLFDAELIAYLASVAFTTAGTPIRYNTIANLLLGIEGVLDYASLTVNLGTANIVIAQEEVAVIGLSVFT